MSGSRLFALHEAVQKCVSEAVNGLDQIDCEVVWAPECRGDWRLPLFCSDIKSWVNLNCHVDGLVILDGKVRLLFEIDESDIRPTALFGKFLAACDSQYFIHWTKLDRPIPITNAVLFQVVSTMKLPDGTWKKDQFKRIESDIKEMLKGSECTPLDDYRLLCGTPEEFGVQESMGRVLIHAVRDLIFAGCPAMCSSAPDLRATS